MKKKALSLLLTLALCLSLLPTAAWATEDEGESSPAAQSGETHADHPVCGNLGSDCPDPGHSSKHTADITDWTAISSESELRNAQANGHYYLEQDVEINGNSWEPKNGVVLCLNGNTLKATGDFNVIEIDNTTFTLTDCKNTGEVTHDTGKTGSGVFNRYGTFNMYGGNITKNTSTEYGGGVYNRAEQGTSGTSSSPKQASFYMYGGSITGNNAKYGGGVCNRGSYFYMYGGSITHNNATNGGGVYTVPYVTSELFPSESYFDMSGEASITSNTAVKGSGVYSDYDRNTEGKIKLSGSAAITGNTSSDCGGVFMEKGTLNVSDSVKITGNTKTGGTASNVYLMANKTISISNDLSGENGENAEIGVTAENAAPNTSIVVAQGRTPAGYSVTLNDEHAKKVISDDNAYEVKLSNNVLVLTAKPNEHKHYLCGGDSCTEVGNHTDTETDFTAWNETDKLPTTAGNYYLENDVTLTTASLFKTYNDTIYYGWDAPDGVVLCLNGHTIYMENPVIKDDKGNPKKEDVVPVKVSGHFTLTDCHTGNAQGKITHSNDQTTGEKYSGKAVVVLGGTFDMYGGQIADNVSKYDVGGGGVHVLGVMDTTKASIFNFYDGSITGNTARLGGGVSVSRIVWYGPSEFNMYGGSITNNVADSDWSSYGTGGGVYVSWTAKFNMSDGEITGNTASQLGGGVYASALARSYENDTGTTATVKLSGASKITGNTVNGNANNVYLSTSTSNNKFETINSTITIDGNLTGKVGVTAGKTVTQGHPVTIATGAVSGKDYSGIVESDDTSYEIQNRGSILVMAVPGDTSEPDGHTHTWNKYVLDPTDHSRVLLYCSDSTCNASGGSVTVKAPTKLTYAGTPPRATVETSADWKGPEAGNITILYVKKLGEGSVTIFNTEPYTGTGTHYAYIRFLNNNNTIVEAYAEYDLVEKNDVTNKITFPSGQLTYTGSGLRYEKATISEGYNGKFTYTYWVPKGGSTGELDANGLPLAVGTYTVIATYEDDNNYGTARASLEVVAGSNNNNSSSSGGGGGGRTSYPVNTPSKSDNGTVTTTPKNATSGSTVTITVKPDEGYVLDTITVVDSKGNTVKLTDKGNGDYTFTMPSGQVDVKATFAKAAEEETSPFDDVARSDYYYDAVKWAAEQGITGGTGSGKFSPADACTRAQIVTFLWRTAGSPAPKGMSSFTDVPADAYYAKAVAWAVENGITAGTSADKFSPDATCTRAHAVTFLFRLAKGSATGAPGFLDVAADAYYAQPVKWAVDNGITSGIGNGLFGPDNRCTRAQIVTFLYQADKI